MGYRVDAKIAMATVGFYPPREEIWFFDNTGTTGNQKVSRMNFIIVGEDTLGFTFGS